MNLIVIPPKGETHYVSVQENQTLLSALQTAGETLLAPCGGTGTCGRCKVLVRDGEGIRYCLACQTVATDGMEIILENIDALQIEGAQFHPLKPVHINSTYGMAMDIGTTTIVFYLVDLETHEVVATHGKVNPQVAFGADVIARINAADAPDGMNVLCGLMREIIDETEAFLCKSVGINSACIVRRVLVGNTTMQHFACGLSPRTIGVAPFTPVSFFGEVMDLYLPADTTPKQAYIAPAVAGYVGGDITAGLVYTGMRKSSELQLFIDIGTNGEMALGNRDRMICCATAAGPAFEGASITLGMPAMPGSISKVALSTDGFTIETIEKGTPKGICGSGLLDAIACLVLTGLVDETGYLLDEEEAVETIGQPFSDFIGEEQGQTVCYLDNARNVYLTQSDIRKVQLAKAAIRAGIETLAAEWGISCDAIDTVALAGGFGMHLDPHSVTAIGLIPPVLDDRIKACGNTAGKGAIECLFDEGRTEIVAVAEACEYLELSLNKTFNERYIDNMGFED